MSLSPFTDEEIARLRAALGRIYRQLDRQVDAAQLTRTERSIFASVARRGPIGIGELADIEGVNPTMLSRIVAKLTERGLLERRTDEVDRRAAQVALTQAGAQLHERMRTERALLLAEVLQNVPDSAQILTALPALEQLADALCNKRRATGASV